MPLDGNALHSHHLLHKAHGGKDVLENLAALCTTCHTLHHKERLNIAGTVDVLEFVLRDSKQRIVKAWQGVLRGE